MAQERIVLHGPFTELRRTSKRGKVSKRVSVEIESTPLVHTFDDMRLGRGPAEAIRDALTEQLKAIGLQVSRATRARRERWLRDGSSESYQRRFRAPRTRAGTIRKGSFDSEPDRANLDKWGLFSGRLAEGLSVRENTALKSFTVNVTANRLDESTFGQGFLAFLAKLQTLVPGFQNPAELLKSRDVRAAINKSINDLITSAEATAAEKLRELRSARAQLLSRGAGAVVRMVF